MDECCFVLASSSCLLTEPRNISAGAGTTHNGLRPPTSWIENMPIGLPIALSLGREFLSWCSLLSDGYGLCQVDMKLTSALTDLMIIGRAVPSSFMWCLAKTTWAFWKVYEAQEVTRDKKQPLPFTTNSGHSMSHQSVSSWMHTGFLWEILRPVGSTECIAWQINTDRHKIW